MINEKQKSDTAAWVACILIALMFGAFLGSPVPDIWAGRISEAVSALTEQTEESANLHSVTTEERSGISGPAGDTAADKPAEGLMAAGKTAILSKPDSLKTDSMAAYGLRTDGKRSVMAVAAKSETAADNPGKTTEAGISMIVSDPPLSEAAAKLAAEQPDYIVINANRSGVADRKEMDVLVRLINAEAYGLSYKAKVAVGQVVMNRWKGPHYGDDLLAIMTAPYQFTPIHDGSAYKKKIEPDSIEAANAVLSGTGVKELSDDTYYFVDPDFTEDKTIETKMRFVCEIEGIHFFKPPDKNTY